MFFQLIVRTSEKLLFRIPMRRCFYAYLYYFFLYHVQKHSINQLKEIVLVQGAGNLGSFQISTLKLFCKNSHQLLAIKHFWQKVPS